MDACDFDLSGFAFDFLGDDFLGTDPSLTQLLNMNTQQLMDVGTPKSESKPVNDQGNSRFEQPVSADEVRTRNFNVVPKKTRQSNDLSLGVWREWTKFRNALASTKKEPGYPIPEDVGELTDEMFDFWGQRFILEIRRKDGKVYPPNTLVRIVSGIQRYLQTECGRSSVNIMKVDNPVFSGFRTALDTRMKELHADGVGVSVNSAAPVTQKEELKFWESGVFNLEKSDGLSKSVFFYNGKLFGFRGFQEHLNVQAEQFEICTDPENSVRYLKFTPRLRKNSQGGLKNRHANLEPIIHYEQSDRAVSLVELYSKYLSLIPRVGPFYRKPLLNNDKNGNPKFSCGTIPQVTLKNMVKSFYQEAGIETSGRKICNHSARVTMCTSLYNDKFTDKSVKSRSKHSSDAVQKYQREQFQILNDISNCLEPAIKPRATNSTSSSENEKTDITVVKLDTKLEEPIMDPGRDETLTVHVPNCVKKMIIVKTDGKRMVIDV